MYEPQFQFPRDWPQRWGRPSDDFVKRQINARWCAFWRYAFGEAETPEFLRMVQMLCIRAERDAMGLLSGSIPMKMDGTPGIDFFDEEMSKQYPILSAFLFQTTDDEGKKRKGSSLIMFAEDGVFKCGLRENNLGLSLWVTAHTVSSIWDALESKLNERPVPWRAQTVGGGTTRRSR